MPFRQLEGVIGANEVAIYETSIEATSDERFISFCVSSNGIRRTEPLPKPPKKETAAEEGDEENGTDEELLRIVGSDVGTSSVLSVDSQVDSEASSQASDGGDKKTKEYAHFKRRKAGLVRRETSEIG